MITIIPATPSDFPTIKALAYSIWPDTYGAILSSEQLEYMLGKFYSEASLLENYMEKGHRFLLVKEDERALGFASYEHLYKETNTTRIHKIYLLPETQGRGLGKLLIQEIEKIALENHADRLSLNVNRFNKAQHFYKKIGFEIVDEEDVELEFGYLMEDYVMEKQL